MTLQGTGFVLAEDWTEGMQSSHAVRAEEKAIEWKRLECIHEDSSSRLIPGKTQGET
jgi:hypothetical protein